ncbi:MAG: nicotinate-nucleotide diphosphorylase, partial [Nitrospirota bacterium]|nr:nicotinate-nucleotide diphosphorylase [Nitrospirota bacterium]
MGTSQSPAPPPRSYIRQIVHTALEEDLGLGDLTSSTLLSDSMSAKAQIISKEAMIVAGVIVVQEVLHQIDDTIIVQSHQQDGDRVSPQTPLLSLTGNARSLLQAER